MEHHKVAELIANATTRVRRNYLCLGALAVLIWDSFINFRRESSFIWSGSLNIVKCIYLFARYFGIASQLVNCIWVMNGPLSRLYIEEASCRAWFRYSLSALHSLSTTLKVLLSLRVFALYHKAKRTGLLLAFSLCVNELITITLSIRSARTSTLRFDRGCMPHAPPKELPYFFALLVMFHSGLWVMTMYRRGTAFRIGLSRSPLLKLLTREGTCILVAIIAMVAVLLPYALTISPSPHVGFPLQTTGYSLLICRLILNMQRLQTPMTPANRDPELTTDVGLYLESLDFIQDTNRSSHDGRQQ